MTLRHARLTTLQRKKSQCVLYQSVARRLYKDRSLTMGLRKRRPTIVARRPITLAWSPAPAARGTDIGLPTGSGSLIRVPARRTAVPDFAVGEKRATSAALAQSRRHFLGKQSDGIEHGVDRDLAAHIRFHDDASQAKLIAQLPQSREHHVRCTVGRPILCFGSFQAKDQRGGSGIKGVRYAHFTDQ